VRLVYAGWSVVMRNPFPAIGFWRSGCADYSVVQRQLRAVWGVAAKGHPRLIDRHAVSEWRACWGRRQWLGAQFGSKVACERVFVNASEARLWVHDQARAFLARRPRTRGRSPRPTVTPFDYHHRRAPNPHAVPHQRVELFAFWSSLVRRRRR
jgi:hypothetical protein